jgi:hypothetical protein
MDKLAGSEAEPLFRADNMGKERITQTFFVL